MYSKLPNLVIAFHGCDKAVFDDVVKGGGQLKPSQNDYDWLGGGVYFWEQNYERALRWAEQKKSWGSFDEPAVIGAVIDLGRCLNLTDSRYIDLLEEEYSLLKKDTELLNLSLPVNEGRAPDKLFRKLDCAVVEHLHARIEGEGLEPFDSARGLFSEGEPIYEGAGFKKKTHVQICVRNPNCIKGYFSPVEPSGGWRIP